MPELWLVGLIVALALVFDFINGFHDAANSIATVVSTRVLSPRWAVVWAATFNFLALWFFGLHVAKTVAKGVSPEYYTLPVVTGGLIGAIFWNLLTWWRGLPSSSSHALVGGFAGAALAYGGPAALIPSVLLKIGAFIFVAPLLGLALGWLLMLATYWAFRRSSPARVGKLFRKLQLVSAAAYSLGHGGDGGPQQIGSILTSGGV